MHKERRELKIDDVRTATHFSREHLTRWIERAERAFADLDKEKRVEKRECRWCFYGIPYRIACQAFTTKPCDWCSKDMTFPNTNTTRVCRECSEELGICMHCCADIDLVDRRKLEKKKR